jgi:alpha-galactosidase
MGWNSWNRFGIAISDGLLRETAEAMVGSGMRDAGYRYDVVVDDGWEAPQRDAEGDLVADGAKFPSGIGAVADHVHGLRLRFGIYTDAGTRTCQGLPGSLGYEFRDAMRFAEWGVDFVKVDWCHTDGLSAPATYERWREAILATGRPIVLSICEWGRSQPWTWGGTVGHLWRTCWDIQPEWDSVMTILDRQEPLHLYSGPDHWNDPDMLEVGNGGMSESEDRAHFALWAMLAAPLMAGNDLREMSEATRATLTAPEVIAIDQDVAGKQGRRVRRDEQAEVWAKKLADPGARAVLLLNRGDSEREIAVDFDRLGWARNTGAAVRDLFERCDLGHVIGGYAARVPPHGAMLLRIARR